MDVINAWGGAPIFWIALLGLTILILLTRAHRILGRPARRAQPQRHGSKRIAAAEAYTDRPAKIAAWEVEMYELARGLSGELDSKMAILQQLIRDADQAAVRIECLLNRTPRAVDTAEVRVQPTTQAEALTALAAPHGESARADGSEDTPEGRHHEIYALADAGHSSADIAKIVDSPRGEVELILRLRRQTIESGYRSAEPGY